MILPLKGSVWAYLVPLLGLSLAVPFPMDGLDGWRDSSHQRFNTGKSARPRNIRTGWSSDSGSFRHFSHSGSQTSRPIVPSHRGWDGSKTSRLPRQQAVHEKVEAPIYNTGQQYYPDHGQFGEPLPHQFDLLGSGDSYTYALPDYPPSHYASINEHMTRQDGSSSSSSFIPGMEYLNVNNEDAYVEEHGDGDFVPGLYHSPLGHAQGSYSSSSSVGHTQTPLEYDFNVSDFHRGHLWQPVYYPKERHESPSIEHQSPAAAHPTVASPHPTSPVHLVWNDRDADEQYNLVEIASKRRGIRYKEARRLFALKLTEELETSLLSGDQGEVYDALAKIFKIKDRIPLPIWMDSMTEEESDRLVERIEQLSHVSKDIIRLYFVRQQTDPDTANALLSLNDYDFSAFCYSAGFLHHNHIVHMGGKKQKGSEEGIPDHDWQFGLPSKKRRVVVDMVAERCKKGRAWTYSALKENHIPKGFGKAFLVADEDTRNRLVRILRNANRPIPAWYESLYYESQNVAIPE
ncbi:hypothetical protein CBS101457_003034 [Exobasidium rhododendri]|nr:hypothetical protein CBS101457_003034 [Exobasidium rhododendri]